MADKTSEPASQEATPEQKDDVVDEGASSSSSSQLTDLERARIEANRQKALALNKARVVGNDRLVVFFVVLQSFSHSSGSRRPYFWS